MTEETRTAATSVSADGVIITITPRETSWTSPRVKFYCIVSDVLSSMILQWRPFPQGWLITSSYWLHKDLPIRGGRTFTDTILDAYEGKILTVEGTPWDPELALDLSSHQKDVVDVEATKRAYHEEIERAVGEESRTGARAEVDMFMDWNMQAARRPWPLIPGHSSGESMEMARRLIVRCDNPRYIFMRDDVVPAIIRELKRVRQTQT